MDIPSDAIFQPVASTPGGKGKIAISSTEHNERLQALELKERLAGVQFTAIKIYRLEPKIWKNRKIEGYLDTSTVALDEDDIKQRYGGGKYSLAVVGSNGKPVGTPAMLDIAGDPLVAGQDTGQDLKEMVAAISSTKEAETRAVLEAREKNEMFQLQMLQGQIDQANAQNRELRATIAELNTQLRESMLPRENPQQDKLIQLIAEGNNRQTEQTQTRFESELRQLRENAIETERRLRDSHEREKERLTAAHEREVHMLRTVLERESTLTRDTSSREVANMQATHEARIMAIETAKGIENRLLADELGRVRADAAALRNEVETLRQKKDQSILEKAAEVAKLKELLADDKDDKEDDEDKSPLGAFLGKLADSDMMKAIATRLVAAGTAAPMGMLPPAPQPQAQAPRPLPRRTPTTQPGVVAPPIQPPAPLPLPVAEKPTEKPKPQVAPIAPPDSATVQTAVDLCRQAMLAGEDPAAFAAKAKPLLPQNVLQELAAKGTDGFLEAHGQLKTFGAQSERNWIRRVGKALAD